jgi:hypothetical protein
LLLGNRGQRTHRTHQTHRVADSVHLELPRRPARRLCLIAIDSLEILLIGFVSLNKSFNLIHPLFPTWRRTASASPPDSTRALSTASTCESSPRIQSRPLLSITAPGRFIAPAGLSIPHSLEAIGSNCPHIFTTSRAGSPEQEKKRNAFKRVSHQRQRLTTPPLASRRSPVANAPDISSPPGNQTIASSFQSERSFS